MSNKQPLSTHHDRRSPHHAAKGRRRVVLRPIDRSDLQVLTDILAEAGVSRWWGEHDLMRVESEFLNGTATSMAIEIGGVLAGAVQFTEETDPDYRRASVDIFLSDQWQGYGYGPEALKLLASHLINSRGHHRLTIDPALENDRAIRAYSSVGFRPVGVMRKYERGPDGRWRDSLLMDLLAEDLDLKR
ncbi:MAG: GNAT family N-acetyltransferase [Actinobacteria bacterium]|nr:GNAT family N-acetyltransferase [Actinomycetota bacterium]